MHRIRHLATAALVAAATFVQPVAAAADLYVSPIGSGSSGCTRAVPCTVGRADALAAPGTTVQLASGNYGSASFRKAGTAAARVRWTSTAKWGAHFSSVSVNGAYIDFGSVTNGFDVGNSSSGLLVNIIGNYSRVIGNHVHDQNVGCGGNGAAAIEAQGWQNGGYNGHHMEILNNLVEDAGVGPRDGSCSLSHGIYSAVPYVRIANNVVRRSIGVGILLWHAAAFNTIVNNTVVENGSHGIMVGNGDTGASVAEGNYVANNIGVGNVYYAVAECCDSSTFGPNTYVDNLGWASKEVSRTVQSTRSGGSETGSLYVDPLFVDLAGGDYRLRRGSPAIDSGTARKAPPDDFAGSARPAGAGFDRGAYESAGAVPTPTPTTTPTPAVDRTVLPDADMILRSGLPTSDFGSDADLQVDGSPRSGS